MCGIVGAISTTPISQQTIMGMRDTMVHRGPDYAGIWSSEDSRICLGHQRLSIVDLTPEANQPFISHDGRFVITFNGEIYNFQSLKDTLMQRGSRFFTCSDTEVLLEAFRCWGKACLDRISGMFSFAIWDTLERTLFCARDRVGEKPFYYAVIGSSFIFASEIKALLLWPGFHKEINPHALIDYLFFGFVADPKCIWESCFKLSPGHWMSVKMDPGSNSLTIDDPVVYWDMEFDPDYSISDWSPKILETLKTAAAEMASADVSVGSFLSGGVDSSSITAALCKTGHSVRTFTIGFEEHGYDERPWASQVSQQYGTTHNEKIVAADDVDRVFQKLLWHYDEPFNDFSYLPTFYLCREARKSITVALSGDGADELFAGYIKYQRLGMRESMGQFLPNFIFQKIFSGTSHFLSRKSQLYNSVKLYGKNESDMVLDMLNTAFSLSDIRAASRGSLAKTLKHYNPREVVSTLMRKRPPNEVGLLNAMRYLDLKLTLAGDILVKVDRASMSVSLEVRPVYLHRDMIALSEKIPSHLLADRNHSKEALKSALRAWLPETLLYRKKQGFAMPLNEWVNRGLFQKSRKKNANNPLDDLLDTKFLEKNEDRSSSLKNNKALLFHSLFFLENWLEKWEQ